MDNNKPNNNGSGNGGGNDNPKSFYNKACDKFNEFCNSNAVQKIAAEFPKIIKMFLR